MGGDEFVVLLGELGNAKDAAAIGGNILHELPQPFNVERHELWISCSIAISMYPDDGKTLTELMINADQAMYRVKKERRNGYRFFSPESPEPRTATPG